MKICIKLIATALLCCAILAVGMPAVMAADDFQKSALVEKVKGGEIDWGKEMYYAYGEGVVPSPAEEPNRARALLKAKGYARMQATANLLMAVEGTTISYEAFGKDYMAQSETLRQKIEGYVKNVEILMEKKITVEGQAVVRLLVGSRMYGPAAPGSALLAQLAMEDEQAAGPDCPENAEVKSAVQQIVLKPEAKPVKVELMPQPKPQLKSEPKPKSTPKSVAKPKATPVQPVAPEVVPDIQTGAASETKSVIASAEPAKPAIAVAESSQPAMTAQPLVIYTGVIINTTGFKVARAMSPKIRHKDGSEIWGTLNMDPDVVQDHGPVAYARSLDEAKKHVRAGSNPMVITAVGRAGGSRMCDAVLSDEDAQKLLAASSVAKPPFLDQMAVVFVVDPVKLF